MAYTKKTKRGPYKKRKYNKKEKFPVSRDEKTDKIFKGAQRVLDNAIAVTN